jgi:hypothetical protein
MIEHDMQRVMSDWTSPGSSWDWQDTELQDNLNLYHLQKEAEAYGPALGEAPAAGIKLLRNVAIDVAQEIVNIYVNVKSVGAAGAPQVANVVARNGTVRDLVGNLALTTGNNSGQQIIDELQGDYGVFVFNFASVDVG